MEVLALGRLLVMVNDSRNGGLLRDHQTAVASCTGDIGVDDLPHLLLFAGALEARVLCTVIHYCVCLCVPSLQNTRLYAHSLSQEHSLSLSRTLVCAHAVLQLLVASLNVLGELAQVGLEDEPLSPRSLPATMCSLATITIHRLERSFSFLPPHFV